MVRGGGSIRVSHDTTGGAEFTTATKRSNATTIAGRSIVEYTTLDGVEEAF